MMPVVILYEPQNPLNIGAVARACLNHNVTDLRIVNPRVWDVETMSITVPNGGEFFAENTRLFGSWEDAVHDVRAACAFTARGRKGTTERGRLDDVLDSAAFRGTGRCAFVFGREDFGLPNAIVDRCQTYATLETSEQYSSLNLAQACIIALNRAFMLFGQPEGMPDVDDTHDKAPLGSVERMLSQAESALDAISFFKGDQRENVLTTLRRVFLRAELDERELATFWGVFTETERATRRD